MESTTNHQMNGEFAPNEIFKYMGKHGFDFLKTRLMRMTPAELTNDPFELKCHYDGTRIEGLDPSDCLLCYSEVPNNIPMWAYYADNLCGMVVGFDRTHPFFRDLKKVAYKEMRPHYKIDGEVENSLFEKSCRWQHEQELRIVKPRSSCTKILENDFKTEISNMSADDFGMDDTVNYMIEIPAAAIMSVTVARSERRFSPKRAEELVNFLKSSETLSHVRVLCWHTSTDTWDIQIEPHPLITPPRQTTSPASHKLTNINN
ncbi:hypothetical protein [Maritalea porphyrae]|uniref:hypothetical protein n=1 Tax=Maritalea porphyrae TaxID=880732 RepID=UPI0022AF8908|nr:hypothetical protein [Maritalea porphyrae]MCZ4271052.1 hypothetical protein [Maritalea porphyrae]